MDEKELECLANISKTIMTTEAELYRFKENRDINLAKQCLDLANCLITRSTGGDEEYMKNANYYIALSSKEFKERIEDELGLTVKERFAKRKEASEPLESFYKEFLRQLFRF